MLNLLLHLNWKIRVHWDSLQIGYGPNSLFVNQRKYVTDLLSKFNMSTCKLASIPFSMSHKLQLDSEDLLSNPTQYCILVGALQFATFTRPDVTYSQSSLSIYAQTNFSSFSCCQTDSQISKDYLIFGHLFLGWWPVWLSLYNWNHCLVTILLLGSQKSNTLFPGHPQRPNIELLQ